MKHKSKIISIIVSLLLPFFAHAQTANYWYPNANNLQPIINTYGLQIPKLGSTGTPCVDIANTSGLFSTTTCGGGTNYFTNSSATTSLTTGSILTALTGTFGTVNATSTTGTSTFADAATFAGFVGIGTTTPTTALSVTGTTTTSGLAVTGPYMTLGNNNTIFATTTNIGFGYQAGQYALSTTSTAVNGIVAIGYGAMSSTSLNTSSNGASVAIGDDAAQNLTTGGVVAIGLDAAQDLTTGAHDFALGAGALEYGTTTHDVVAIGTNAMQNNNDEYDVAVGVSALQGAAGGLAPYANQRYDTAIGFGAMQFASSTANYNVGVGTSVLNELSTGQKNIVLGAYTLTDGITTGSSNILLGYNAAVPSSSGSGQLNIGNGIWGTGFTQFGSTSVSNVKLSIGTTTALAQLFIEGSSSVPTVIPFEIASSTGTTTFIIGANGNVGIGTSTPGSLLVVAGTSLFTGAEVNQSTLNVLGQTTLATASSTGLTVTATSTLTGLNLTNLSNTFLAVDPSGNVIASSSPGGGTGNSAWTIGNGFIYNATSTDLVSIGTSSPFAKLSLLGTYGSTTPIFTVASTTSAAGATSSLMTVLSNGNIGVATTTPLAPFSISGSNSGNNGLFNITNTVSASFANTFDMNDSNLTAGQAISFNEGHNPANNNSAGFNFLYQASGSGLNAINYAFFGGSAVETLLANHNVGIGSTTPGSLLSLEGSLGSTTPVFTVASSTGLTLFQVNTTGAIIEGGITPTIATSTGAGPSGTASIVGTQNGGVMTVVTGGCSIQCTASVPILVVTYPTACPTGSAVQYSAATSTLASAEPGTSVIGTTTSFTLNAGATALSPGATYIWNYHVDCY